MPKANPLTYSWNTAGLAANATNAASITLTAPSVTADSNYTVSVTVSDGKLSVTKSVVVDSQRRTIDWR